MEFYPTIGVTRDVGSRPDVKYYGLRALLPAAGYLTTQETMIIL